MSDVNSLLSSSKYREATEPMGPINNEELQRGISKAKSIGDFMKVDNSLKRAKQEWVKNQKELVGSQYFSKTEVSKSKSGQNQRKEKSHTQVHDDWQSAIKNARQGAFQMTKDLANFKKHYQGQAWAEDLSRVNMFDREMSYEEIEVLATGKRTNWLGQEVEVEGDPQTKMEAQKRLKEFDKGRRTQIKAGLEKTNFEGTKVQGAWYKRWGRNIANAFRTIFGYEKKTDILKNVQTTYANQLQEKKKPQQREGGSFGIGFLRFFGIAKKYVAKHDLKVYTESIREAAQDLVKGGIGSNFRNEWGKVAEDVAKTPKYRQAERIDQQNGNDDEKAKVVFEAMSEKVREMIVADVKKNGSKSPYGTPRFKSLKNLDPPGVKNAKEYQFLAEAITTALFADTYSEHVDQKETVVSAEIDNLRVKFGKFDDLHIQGKTSKGDFSVSTRLEEVGEDPEIKKFMKGDGDNVPRPGMHGKEFFAKLEEKLEDNKKEIGKIRDHINELHDDGILPDEAMKTIHEEVTEKYEDRNEHLLDQTSFYKDLFEARSEKIRDTNNATGIADAGSLTELKSGLALYKIDLQLGKKNAKLPSTNDIAKVLHSKQKPDGLIHATANQIMNSLEQEYAFHLEVMHEVESLLSSTEKASITNYEAFHDEHESETPSQYAGSLKKRATELRELATASKEMLQKLSHYNMGGGYNGPLHSALSKIQSEANASAQQWEDLAKVQEKHAERLEKVESGDLDFDEAMKGLESDRVLFTQNGDVEDAYQVFADRARKELVLSGLKYEGVEIDDNVKKAVESLDFYKPKGISLTSKNYIEPLATALKSDDRKMILEGLNSLGVPKFFEALDEVFIRSQPLNREASAMGLALKINKDGSSESRRKEIQRDHHATQTSALLKHMRTSGTLSEGLKKLNMSSIIPPKDGRMLGWMRETFFPDKSDDQWRLDAIAARREALECVRNGGSLENEDDVLQIISNLEKDGFTGMTFARLSDLLFNKEPGAETDTDIALMSTEQKQQEGFALFKKRYNKRDMAGFNITGGMETALDEWTEQVRDFALNLNDMDLGGTTGSRARRLLGHFLTNLTGDEDHGGDTDTLLAHFYNDRVSDPVPTHIPAKDLKTGLDVQIKNPSRKSFEFHQNELERIKEKQVKQQEAVKDLRKRMEENPFTTEFLTGTDTAHKNARQGAIEIVRFLDAREKYRQGMQMKSMENRFGLKLFGKYEKDYLEMEQQRALKGIHWVDPETQTQVPSGKVGGKDLELTWTEEVMGSQIPLLEPPEDITSFKKARSSGNAEMMERYLTETEEGREMVKFAKEYVRFLATEKAVESLNVSETMTGNGLDSLRQFHESRINLLRGQATTRLTRDVVRTAILDVFMASGEAASTFVPENHRKDIEKRLIHYGANPDKLKDVLDTEMPEQLDNELLAKWNKELGGNQEIVDQSSIEMMESIKTVENRVLDKADQTQQLLVKYNQPGQTGIYRDFLRRASQDLLNPLLQSDDPAIQQLAMSAFKDDMMKFNPQYGLSNSRLLAELSERYAVLSAQTGQGISLLEKFHDKVIGFGKLHEFETSLSSAYTRGKSKQKEAISGQLETAMRSTLEKYLHGMMLTRYPGDELADLRKTKLDEEVNRIINVARENGDHKGAVDPTGAFLAMQMAANSVQQSIPNYLEFMTEFAETVDSGI